MIKFTSPLPPSVNNYLGKRVVYSGGRPYVQVYETTTAKAYKRHMKNILERAKAEYGWTKTGEFTYVVCELVVYLSQKHRDSDNMLKCLLDSITENELVYDDSMIMPRVENILIDTENPRVEVKMYVAKKSGIFESENEHNDFINGNCITCKRYNRNCSILKKCVENKIISEVERKGLVMVCNSCKVRAGVGSE